MIVCSFCKSSEEIVKSGFRNNKCGKINPSKLLISVYNYVGESKLKEMKNKTETPVSRIIEKFFSRIFK